MLDIWQFAVVVLTVAVLPGFIVGLAGGLRLPWAGAAAIPISLGIGGLVAWAGRPVGISVDLRSYLVATVVVTLIALVWRLAFLLTPGGRPVILGRLRPPDIRRLVDAHWLIPAAGIGAATLLLMQAGLGRIARLRHGMEAVFQGWDVHWHASVIRWIYDTGIGDPNAMGELQNIESQDPMYYPSAWHVLGAIAGEAAGASPIAVVNVTSVVLPAVMLPASAAVLAWWAVGRRPSARVPGSSDRGLVAPIGAALAAIYVAAIPALMPVGIYVGAWPYLAALAGVGIVAGLLASVTWRPVHILPASLALIGLGQTHPASVPTAVVLVGCWMLLWRLWRPARRLVGPQASVWGARGRWGRVVSRIRDCVLVAAAGLSAAAILLPQWLRNSGQAEELGNFGESVSISSATAWGRVVTMQTRHAIDYGAVWPLIITALVGGVVLLVWRRALWAPVAWLLFTLAAVNSLVQFPQPWGDLLATYGTLHYDTAHRLILPVGMLVAAGAGVAVAAGARMVLLGWSRRFEPVSSVATVVVTAVIAGFLLPWATARTDAPNDLAYVTVHDGRMIDEDDLVGFRVLADLPESREGLIFTNPDEGSGWMYAYNGLPSLFRHYGFPSVPARSATQLLYWDLRLAGTGVPGDPNAANEVDRAFRDLDVRYVYLSPPGFWAWQTRWRDLMDEAWHSRALTPVYQHDQVNIFAVNAAFTDEQLDQMRSIYSPVPMPVPPTKGQMGVARTADEVNQSYYFRPEF